MPGTVILKPIRAVLSENEEAFNKIHPYCIMMIGPHRAKSQVCAYEGKTPAWNEILELKRINEPYCYLGIKDKTRIRDEMLGVCAINLDDLEKNGSSKRWLELYFNKKPVGEILVDMIFAQEFPHPHPLNAKEFTGFDDSVTREFYPSSVSDKMRDLNEGRIPAFGIDSETGLERHVNDSRREFTFSELERKFDNLTNELKYSDEIRPDTRKLSFTQKVKENVDKGKSKIRESLNAIVQKADGSPQGYEDYPVQENYLRPPENQTGQATLLSSPNRGRIDQFKERVLAKFGESPIEENYLKPPENRRSQGTFTNSPSKGRMEQFKDKVFTKVEYLKEGFLGEKSSDDYFNTVDTNQYYVQPQDEIHYDQINIPHKDHEHDSIPGAVIRGVARGILHEKLPKMEKVLETKDWMHEEMKRHIDSLIGDKDIPVEKFEEPTLHEKIADCAENLAQEAVQVAVSIEEKFKERRENLSRSSTLGERRYAHKIDTARGKLSEMAEVSKLKAFDRVRKESVDQCIQTDAYLYDNTKTGENCLEKLEAVKQEVVNEAKQMKEVIKKKLNEATNNEINVNRTPRPDSSRKTELLKKKFFEGIAIAKDMTKADTKTLIAEEQVRSNRAKGIPDTLEEKDTVSTIKEKVAEVTEQVKEKSAEVVYEIKNKVEDDKENRSPTFLAESREYIPEFAKEREAADRKNIAVDQSRLLLQERFFSFGDDNVEEVEVQQPEKSEEKHWYDKIIESHQHKPSAADDLKAKVSMSQGLQQLIQSHPK